MKTSKIFFAAATVALMAASCSDDKDTTLNAPKVTLLEEITFDISDELPLPVGMDTVIAYTYGPAEADDPTVVFTSSDENVATVDADGRITGRSTGDAIIMARSIHPYKINNAEASVHVTVIPELIKVESIDIANTTPVGEDGKIYVTDEIQLAATVNPSDATYKRLVWSSADESLATVDQSGKVTCVGDGQATIYATATDRTGVRGEYTFTIDRYIGAQSITIKPMAEPMTLYYGPVALECVYDPTNATVGSVEWMSDNEEVATVRRGVVTPKGYGTCNIIATCAETGYQASVTVTVETGWCIWDAGNKWNGWKGADFNNHLTGDDRGDAVWRLFFKNPGEGKKWRGDFKIDCSNANPFVMSLANYPVLAVRMTKMNGGNATLDCVFDGYGNAGNPNPKNGIDLGDGTQLLIYNLGNANNYKGLDMLYFRIFQIKLADIPYENVDPAKAYYDIYWIRTFKTEDDAKAFANDQVAAGL